MYPRRIVFVLCVLFALLNGYYMELGSYCVSQLQMPGSSFERKMSANSIFTLNNSCNTWKLWLNSRYRESTTNSLHILVEAVQRGLYCMSLASSSRKRFLQRFVVSWWLIHTTMYVCISKSISFLFLEGCWWRRSWSYLGNHFRQEHSVWVYDDHMHHKVF